MTEDLPVTGSNYKVLEAELIRFREELQKEFLKYHHRTYSDRKCVSMFVRWLMTDDQSSRFSKTTQQNECTAASRWFFIFIGHFSVDCIFPAYRFLFWLNRTRFRGINLLRTHPRQSHSLHGLAWRVAIPVLCHACYWGWFLPLPNAHHGNSMIFDVNCRLPHLPHLPSVSQFLSRIADGMSPCLET